MNKGIRKRSARVGASFCMVLAIIIAQGCTSTRVIHPPDTVDQEFAHSEITGDTTRYLNLRITAAGTESSGRMVAERVAQSVFSRLQDKGFQRSSGTVDVLVNLSAEATVFDRSGNYYRHDGVLDAEILLPRENRSIGTNRFSDRGERKLGETESLRQLADQLTIPAHAWVESMATPLARELGVNDITVQRPRLTTRRRGDSEYAGIFVRTVQDMEGVISCELVAHDRQSRQMTFRVLYYRRDFPEGLLNRLVIMPELQLRP